MTEFPAHVTGDIADMVVLIYEHLSRPFEERFKDCFTALQIHTMCKLAMDGPMTMTELADSMHVTKQQMTKVIGKLSKEGHVSRHHDEQDRRIIISELSSKTREYIKARRSDFSEYIRGTFSKLDDGEFEEFSGAINTINRIMHKLSSSEKQEMEI